MADVYEFHKAFYALPDKIHQDNFILKYINVTKIARRRPASGEGVPKTISIKYFVRLKNTGVVPVCRLAFLSILLLTKNRINGVANRHFRSGRCAFETRGGDRHSKRFAERKEEVCSFIRKLQPIESHYCRDRTNRKYLASELNITKLWTMYDNAVATDHKVKLSYFREIFNTKFNIGFGTPRTDVCSTCLQFSEKIKVEKDVTRKEEMQTELKVHKLRAKAFFSLLKEEKNGLLIVSFDCQKNQPLPKVPDQATYYSRQLYVYNFTVVVGSSKSKMTTDNVFSYVWTEDKYLKGSNEIASCIFHRLSATDLEGIHTLRLVADGCGGQNKNTTLIGMCSKWLHCHAPSELKSIEIIFPVTGHSFLPADRVFALIEREVKKKEIIVNAQEYYTIFAKHSTVIDLGRGDTEIFDWRSATQAVFKVPGQWHFQFQQTKRFILQRSKQSVFVRGEQAYNSDYGTAKNVCKKGKNVNSISPSLVRLGVPPKQLKLRDVNVLLVKHYGMFWDRLAALDYYKSLIERYYTNLQINEDADEENHNDINNDLLCSPQEEPQSLLV